MVFSQGRKPLAKRVISVRGASVRVKRYRPGAVPLLSEEEAVGTVSAAAVPVSVDAPSVQPEASPSGTQTLYQIHKARRIENWAAIQDRLVKLGFAVNFSPAQEVCVGCEKTAEQIFRCCDCGPAALYCEACISIFHSLPHLHAFETYVNGVFLYANVETPVWLRPDGHTCGTSYQQTIVVMDERGRQHKRRMQFCSCETPAETMIRSYLWPSSPKNPAIGFHMGLLEWMTALLLECHVSSKGFVEALKARYSKHHQGWINSHINDIYKVLISECLGQYRNYQYRLRHPTDICVDLDTGTDCPACFENPTKIISFDADFQLVRKIASGRSMSTPKHKGKFFLDQYEVDSFIDNYSGQPIKNDLDCSEFQAGSALRGKVKNKKLDVTAVFGSACRHEFPLHFFNLKHGERIGYSVFLLQKIVEDYRGANIHILYDIACLLESHLKKHDMTGILNEVKLSIPVFHCYGHKMACQVIYNPRRQKGLGLTDGECVERLWSYLGKFSNISKEMTPENRTDLLVDGLLHYGKRIIQKQGTTLVNKLRKATDYKKTSENLFEETMCTLPGCSLEDVKQWSVAEQQLYSQTGTGMNKAKQESLEPKEEYAANLKEHYGLSQSILAVTENGIREEIQKKINSLEQKLKKFESTHKIQRWSVTSNQFEVQLASAELKKVERILSKIEKSVGERTFLLQMMKKYARGQAVALRLGKQMKKTNSVLKQLIKEYNSLNCNKGPHPDKLDLESFNSDRSINITADTKRVLINLSETIERCNEELQLVKTEMICTIHFYKNRHEKLFSFYNESECGVIKSVILAEGLNLERQLLHLSNMFSDAVDTGPIPLSFHHLIGLAKPYFETEIDSILNSIASDEVVLEEADLTDTDENTEQDEQSEEED